MVRQVISAPDAPKAMGAYSPAIITGNLLFVTGQVGQGDDVRAQTTATLENIKRIVEAGGSTMANVVKCTVFLLDLADFPAFDATYSHYFGASPPARSTVQVVALPRGARIELEANALRHCQMPRKPVKRVAGPCERIDQEGSLG